MTIIKTPFPELFGYENLVEDFHNKSVYVIYWPWTKHYSYQALPYRDGEGLIAVLNSDDGEDYATRTRTYWKLSPATPAQILKKTFDEAMEIARNMPNVRAVQILTPPGLPKVTYLR